MAKRTQVVLTKDVIKLGKNGDLVEVAPGYARNYLIPQSIAVRATPGILRQVERRREEERQRQLELKQQAEAQKKALEAVGVFKIAKQVGPKPDRLYHRSFSDKIWPIPLHTHSNWGVDLHRGSRRKARTYM